jgi:putative flippase GtrA
MIVARISFRQYMRFLLVGGMVGLLTIAVRELLGRALGADSEWHYSFSIVLAYALGIVCSFLLNHRFTFGQGSDSRDWRSFVRFISVAVLGMLVTWLLALALRYGLQLDAVLGDFARPVAFATATLIGSLATYPLNARLVFGQRIPEV